MAQRVNAINKAFGKCIFISRDNAINVIKKKINECDVLTENPTDISMAKIDNTHDRLCLTFNNGTLDGVVSWKKTQNDRHYIFDKFEIT